MVLVVVPLPVLPKHNELELISDATLVSSPMIEQMPNYTRKTQVVEEGFLEACRHLHNQLVDNISQ